VTERGAPFWKPRRVGDQLQKRLLNPLDKRAFQLGIPPPGDALLETIGRRTGKPRVTPVCDGLVGDAFWIIAQHGRDSDWVCNIEVDPRVRVNTGRGWRVGTAHILDDDDPETRRRILSQGGRWRSLCLSASSAMSTNPLTIRIDLDRNRGGTPTVLEPAARAFVETAAEPPYPQHVDPVEGRRALEELQASETDKPAIDEEWVTAEAAPGDVDVRSQAARCCRDSVGRAVHPRRRLGVR
jgi:deazaflavin-dependent oxidoreductase (nitroreductase family)